jgi:hypothetical protein
MHVVTGADVEVSAENAVYAVINENILNASAEIDDGVQLFFGLLIGVADFVDAGVGAAALNRVALCGRENGGAAFSHQCDVLDDDLPADGQPLGQGRTGNRPVTALEQAEDFLSAGITFHCRLHLPVSNA